ncbi:MAG: response regulator [Desulfotignum sp.]|nr:response regulator [Desulfotignum sp.]
MKSKQNFLSYLMVRIFPPLLILVLVFIGLAYHQHARYQMKMETQRLHADAERIFQSTTERLEDLSRQAAYLAKNDFIIGSLIDARFRNEVLPVFFQSLKAHGLPVDMTGTIALLDYKGRVIAANHPMEDMPAVGAWLDDPEGGEERRQIDETGLTLISAVAIYRPGSREGAVVIRLSAFETAALMDFSHLKDGVSITTGYGSQVFHSSSHEPLPAQRLIRGRIQGNPGGWIQEVVVSSDQHRILSILRRSFFMDLGVMTGAMTLLAILLFLVVKKAVSPLEGMALSLKRIVGHEDLSIRLNVNGPAEMQHLSNHINQMLDRLGASTRSVEELQTAAQNQRILLDNIPVQIWYLKTIDTYGAVNRAHADFMGKRPENLAYKCLNEFLPPDEAAICKTGDQEVFETGEAIVSEEWLLDSAGEDRLLSITKTPRLHRDGSVEFVVCSAVDITEQRQMEIDLKTERSRLEAIITGTRAGTWEWNVQTGEAVFNERWAEIIGYTLEELNPVSIETWQKFVHPDDLAQSGALLERHFNGKLDYYQAECRMKHRGGYWVWVLDRGRVSTWTDDGRPLMMSGTHLDITESKIAEESLKKARDEADSANRAKSVFLASMSHEIRTPLSAILGFGDILGRDASLSPAQMDKVKTINRSGRHLLKLINDILDMSRIESGRVTIETAGFSLKRLLDNLESMFCLTVESKGLQWALEIPDQMPPLIAGDEARLRQVLINLVGNAVKFTTSGKITVRVHLDADKETPDLFCLTMAVADTGPGIAESDLVHIFDAFQQCQTTCQIGGTGLGLAISKRLVELMGGQITVNSQEGKGSCFQFSLPVKAAAGSMETQTIPSQIPVGLAPGSDPKRILVVDDLEVNLDLLTSILAVPGFEIRIAKNGEQALEISADWAPHAVFMDIRMPVMDGYEAIRRLKADEATAGIFIIAITAVVFEEDVEKIYDAGADRFIGKPFKAEEIFHMLGDGLGLTYEYPDPESGDAGTCDTDQKPVTLTETDMVRLPAALTQAVQDVLEIGDVYAMEQLGPEIRKIDAGVAEKIRVLVKRYDYDAILKAIPQRSLEGRRS